MKRRTVVGLAVAPDGLTAVVCGGGNGEPSVSATTDIDEISALALASAFRALGEEVGSTSLVAHVALLPPLVELKTLQMPPVRRSQLTELVEARARRCFVRAAGRAVVATEPISSAPGSPIRVAATCASETLIESLFEAAEEAGWTIASVVSGYDAVAAAVSRRSRDEAEAAVPLVQDGLVEWLHVVDGRACCVRRGRAESDEAPPLEAACGAVDVVAIDDPAAVASLPLGVLAARHAHMAHGPELVPRELRTIRTRAGRRVGSSLLAAAAVMMIVAAWAEHRGVERELEYVQEARSAVALRVEAVLAKRDQLATLDRGLVLLSTLEASAPDWARVLTDLADNLPTDASITWMHGLADSLRVEGTARDASRMLESLRQSRVLSRVRADAPFERQSTESGEVERFRLAAEITPRSDGP